MYKLCFHTRKYLFNKNYIINYIILTLVVRSATNHFVRMTKRSYLKKKLFVYTAFTKFTTKNTAQNLQKKK